MSMIKKLPALLFCSLLCTVAQAQQRVFIELQEPSVAAYYAQQLQRSGTALSHRQQQQHHRRIQVQQSEITKKLAQLDVQVHSSLQMALNGFRASVSKQELMKLRRIPGVKSVKPLAHMEFDNSYSVPWVEANKLWENTGTGSGFRIAIIDTGIDYLHENFGGAGSTADYDNNDPNVIENGSFPTDKVVGGWDFAGPTYNSRLDDKPQPDADPLDVHGHGSHVAGSAAGVGVPFHIGPGVARDANLLALKVFSDIGGSTDLTVDALDRALDPNQDGSLDDRVDVINMSLGSRFGVETDPVAIAAGNAAAAGVVVVASAGNNGDVPYVLGSPAINKDVIAVAASTAGKRREIALRVISQADNLQALQYPALESGSTVRFDENGIQGELRLLHSTDDDPLLACGEIVNADQITGSIAVARRGGCSYLDKFQNAQNAGALALIVINTRAGVSELRLMGGLVDNVNLPGLMITLEAGEELLAMFNLGSAPNADINRRFTLPSDNSAADEIAVFSSRGPGLAFKPDVTAPGRLIYSTAAGSGRFGRTLRGTSMAAPHVAGLAVLLKQHHPMLSVAAIKSLLQNSASVVHDDNQNPAAISRQGAGMVHGGLATLQQIYSLPGAVFFGYQNPLADFKQTQQLTMHSLDGRARHLSVTQEISQSIDGVNVACPDQLALAADSATEFSLTLNYQADGASGDDSQNSMAEASGWCVFNDGEREIRLPYLVTLDPAASIEVTRDNDSLTLSNSAAAGRANSFVRIPVVTGQTDQDGPQLAAMGFRRTQIFGFAAVEFGIVMQNAWRNPANRRFVISIDTDDDPHYERVLFASDGSFFGNQAGSYMTGLDYTDDIDDLGGDNAIFHWFAEDLDFQDRVIILPYFNFGGRASNFLKPGETQFNFRLQIYDRYERVSEVFGFIDTLNPQLNHQHAEILAAGEQIQLAASTQAQLWLMPGNQLPVQHSIITTGKSVPAVLKRREPAVKRSTMPGQ